MPARSGSGGHVGGQDVVGVAVEVLAGSVVTHRGARVGVAGSDLDIAKVHARVEHGGYEGMAKHVRVWASDPDTRRFSQEPPAAGLCLTGPPRAAGHRPE